MNHREGLDGDNNDLFWLTEDTNTAFGEHAQGVLMKAQLDIPLEQLILFRQQVVKSELPGVDEDSKSENESASSSCWHLFPADLVTSHLIIASGVKHRLEIISEQ